MKYILAKSFDNIINFITKSKEIYIIGLIILIVITLIIVISIIIRAVNRHKIDKELNKYL